MSARHPQTIHTLNSSNERLGPQPTQAITAPGLQNVPMDWMHCTLLHAIGLGRDAIDIDALLSDVRRATQDVEPFALTFDRPSVGTVGVEISGWPGKPFAMLVDIVSAAMDRTGAAFKAGPSRSPHISLGYTSTGAEKRRMAGLERTPNGGLVPVMSMSARFCAVKLPPGRDVARAAAAAWPAGGRARPAGSRR